MNKLTTTGLNRFPPDFKAKIAAKSRNKGANYERTVAKKIAEYFGEKWDDCFIRTSLSSYAQPRGDLRPVNNMLLRWQAAKLGPLECKCREEWGFAQLFRSPNKNKLVEYWLKSNEDTGSDNTVLFFTKNGLPDLVMHLADLVYYECPMFTFNSDGTNFTIVTLKDFLTTRWPK